MSAHKYELMFIADPELDERGLKKLTEQYLEIVTNEEDAASGMVTFMATANGIYHVDSVPEGDDGSWLSLDPLVLNAIIAAAIVIVASVAVYFLLRRDRGPGPSCTRPHRRRRCRGRSRS